MFRLLKQGSRFLSSAYNYTDAADGPFAGPYRQGQFKVSVFKSGDRYCAAAEVPEPSAPTQCRLIGFSVNHDGTDPVYRTVELSSDGTYCLCGWTEDRVHINIAAVGSSLSDMKDAMIRELLNRTPVRDLSGITA